MHTRSETGAVGDNEWEISHPRWKAINWKGEISENETTPNDEQFAVHFKNLLNFNTDGQPEPNLDGAPYVPVLDDPT